MRHVNLGKLADTTRHEKKTIAFSPLHKSYINRVHGVTEKDRQRTTASSNQPDKDMKS